MAHPTITAERLAIAIKRVQRAVTELQKDTPENERKFVGYTSKDASVRQAELMESLADFLEGNAGMEKPAENVIGHYDGPTSEPVPQSAVQAQGGGARTLEYDDADKGGKEETEGEEPTFHGYPLSHFDDMSDEEILDVKGIGQKTLEQIRAAQEKAK